MSAAATSPVGGNRTTWAHDTETPLRRFLRTETVGRPSILAWRSRHSSGRTSTPTHTNGCRTPRFGQNRRWGPVHDLRYWVNSGLMTLFFFVAGLEVRREFDMGELRDRRRVALPVIVGVGGIVIPIAGFLALNIGRHSIHGWAITMSTDTALALGMLALVGRGAPDRCARSCSRSPSSMMSPPSS